MTITVTTRWKVADVQSARKWGKVARESWTKAGATGFRTFLVMFGPNTGNWIFAIEFPDLATFGKARATVRASEEFKAWNADAAKFGNVMLDQGCFDEMAL